jgi:hypothetical protein
LADIPRSPEGRAELIAAYAKSILQQCPKLDEFTTWSPQVEENLFGSEVEAALRWMLDPDETMDLVPGTG